MPAIVVPNTVATGIIAFMFLIAYAAMFWNPGSNSCNNGLMSSCSNVRPNSVNCVPTSLYLTSFTLSIVPFTSPNVSPTVVRDFTTCKFASSPIVPNATAAMLSASCSSVQLLISPTMESITSFMVPFPSSQFLNAFFVPSLKMSIFFPIVPSPRRFFASLIESFTLSRLYAPFLLPFASNWKYSSAEYPACWKFPPYSATLSPSSPV